MRTASVLALMMSLTVLMAPSARADTWTTFFDPSQTATSVSSGTTSETITSEGYKFTYTADKLWSSYPGGPPTGRFFTVTWPDGIQAQAVTAGPSSGTGAQITISRVDRKTFDLESLTFKLLANTAGAGANLEIMPLLGGEDGLPNPVMLNATGYGGQTFSYDTPQLVGYDTYKMKLYVDWAVTGLTLFDTVPEPATAGLILLALPLLVRRRRTGYSLV